MSVVEYAIAVGTIIGGAVVLYMHIRLTLMEDDLRAKLRTLEEHILRIQDTAVSHQRRVLCEIGILGDRVCTPREYVLTPKDDYTD